MATREQQNIRNKININMSPFAGGDPTTNDVLERPIKNKDYYFSKQYELSEGSGGISRNWREYDNGQELIDRWFFSSAFGVTEKRLKQFADRIRYRISIISSYRQTDEFTNPINLYELVYMENSSNWEALNNTNWNVPLAKLWQKDRSERIQKMKEQKIIEEQNKIIQEEIEKIEKQKIIEQQNKIIEDELILKLELQEQKKINMEKQKKIIDKLPISTIKQSDIITRVSSAASLGVLALILLINTRNSKN